MEVLPCLQDEPSESESDGYVGYDTPFARAFFGDGYVDYDTPFARAFFGSAEGRCFGPSCVCGVFASH